MSELLFLGEDIILYLALKSRILRTCPCNFPKTISIISDILFKLYPEKSWDWWTFFTFLCKFPIFSKSKCSSFLIWFYVIKNTNEKNWKKWIKDISTPKSIQSCFNSFHPLFKKNKHKCTYIKGLQNLGMHPRFGQKNKHKLFLKRAWINVCLPSPEIFWPSATPDIQ